MSDLSTAEREPKSVSVEGLDHRVEERTDSPIYSDSVRESYSASHSDDEVSLIDIVLVLIKHRNTIWVTIAAFIVAALIFVLLTPKVYRYSSVVEVGSYLSQAYVDSNSQYQLIETSDQVISQLNKRFLQQELLAYVQANPGSSTPDFEVIASPNSNVIEIAVNASEKVAPDVLGIMSSAIAGLLADHQVKFTEARERVLQEFHDKVLEITEMQAEVQSLTQNKEVYVENLLQVDADIIQLNQQIEDLTKDLSILNSNRSSLLSNGESNLAANAFILLNSNIENARLLLSELSLEKSIVLSDKKSQLQRELLFMDKKLKTNQAKLSNAQAALIRLKKPMNSEGLKVAESMTPAVSSQPEGGGEGEEKNSSELNTAKIMDALVFDETFYANAYIRPTRVVVDPHQSIKSQSLGAKVVIIMALLVGVFFAIFMGLISEFWEKVTQRRRQLSEKISQTNNQSNTLSKTS